MPDKIPFSEFTFRGSTYVLKDAVARAAIDQLNSFEYVVCTSAEDTPINITWGNVTGALLPDVDTTHKIYLVPSTNGNNDIFDEYLTIKNGNEYLWEKIGNTDVDLTGYVVKDNAVVTSSLSMGRLVNTEVGNNSVALGQNVSASGVGSHAEGINTTASGRGSHAEGQNTIADGIVSHVEGYNRLASGSYAHAEGSSGTVYVTKATVSQGSTTYTFSSSLSSNLDIGQTMSIGDSYVGKIIAIDAPNRTITLDTPFDKNYSDVPFTIYYTDASGTASHVEGMNTHASGNVAHAEGVFTIAASAGQHVQGKYNIADSNDTYADIVGNGTDKANRSNAYVLDWNGNARFAGDVYVGCDPDSTGGTKLATINDLPDVPVQDVQVNGVSVLNQNGVADVPIGGSNTLGVVKTALGYGITIDSGNGVISIDKSGDSLIKSGTENYRPIVPSSQHSAAFYGLAKAAGDLTQSQSSNAVGTYTPEAKAAIQTMLGIETGTEVVRLI